MELLPIPIFAHNVRSVALSCQRISKSLAVHVPANALRSQTALRCEGDYGAEGRSGSAQQLRLATHPLRDVAAPDAVNWVVVGRAVEVTCGNELGELR